MPNIVSFNMASFLLTHHLHVFVQLESWACPSASQDFSHFESTAATPSWYVKYMVKDMDILL